jgi:hypothetical protein
MHILFLSPWHATYTYTTQERGRQQVLQGSLPDGLAISWRRRPALRAAVLLVSVAKKKNKGKASQVITAVRSPPKVGIGNEGSRGSQSAH